MGTNGQLGTGEEDDVTEPWLMKSKQLENRQVIAVSSGGQHTIMIAKDN
jgi:regulator of chromosome condensation